MDDQNQSDELYPIAVLIDELKVRKLPHKSNEEKAVRRCITEC